ncbi:TetR family transcriptional regulator [Brenneria populi]|uniref:TetR family transcriptional regulator n=1 Tax=Brenneria populi TaxID=1505588 RepID=A0ABU6JKL6_9GAMM|nr:TetR family transcriptional regulator [Brenneria populi Li et al. 2015]
MAATKTEIREPDVRQRILNEAITIFASKGGELTTIREITEATRVNIAAVNYYFGSKEGLLKAVLNAVLDPLNAMRLRLLDAVEEQYRHEAPPVEALLEALLRPLVKTARAPDGGRIAVRLLQHLRAAPRESVTALVSDKFDHVAARFFAAFERAAPQLSRAEIVWRYEFARGAAMHVLADSDPQSGRLAVLSRGLCNSDDDDEVLANLLRFAAAGFNAPPLGERA